MISDLDLGPDCLIRKGVMELDKGYMLLTGDTWKYVEKDQICVLPSFYFFFLAENLKKSA